MKKILLLLCTLLGTVGAWATATDVTVIDKTKDATTYGSLSDGTFTTNAASGMAGVTISGIKGTTATSFAYGACLGLTSTASGTITMTAPAGYVIIGYTLTARSNTYSVSYTLTPSAGGNAVTTSTDGVTLSTWGLDAQTASFTYSASSANSFYIPSMVITIGTAEDVAFPKSQAEAYNTAKGWTASIQTAEGLVSNASNYSGNAIITSGDGGGLPALLDNNTSTYCHTAYSGSGVANPGANHYIQAYIEDGTQAFYLYTYKRNDNNRPTQIDITASNDGSNWTTITSLTSGLTTSADFLSDKISLDATYKYIRFTVPSTNTGAKYGDYVFFTYSEFWLLPSNSLVDDAVEIIKSLSHPANLTQEKINEINSVDLAVRSATIAPWKAAFIASAGESSNFGKVGWPSASAYSTFCDAINALTVDDDYESDAATAMATLWGTITYPATGYYYLHNKGTNRYAFSDETVSTSQDFTNDEARTAKYVWKVTLDGTSVKIYSLTGHGLTLNNNGGQQTGNIALETPDANNYTAARGAFYVGCIQDPNQNAFTQSGSAYASATNPMKLTYYNGDRNNTKAYWIFESVDASAYDVYTVNFVGAPADNYVEYTGSATTGNKKVYDGGQYFITKDAAVSTSDFTPEAAAGYATEVTISNKTITVTYTVNDYEALVTAYFTSEKQENFANAGHLGYMQNTGENFTNLSNLIMSFVNPSHVYTESDYNNLVTYYEACAANVVYPTTGKFYLVKNNYNGKYLRVTGNGGRGTVLADLTAAEAAKDASAHICFTEDDSNSKLYMRSQGKYFNWVYNMSGYGAYLADGKDKYVHFANPTPGVIAFSIALGNGEGENAGDLNPGFYALFDENTKVVGGSSNGAASDHAWWTFEEASTLTVDLNGPIDGKYYATACLPFAATISGATAYTLSLNASEDALHMTEVTGEVAAGTPVLLRGESEEATATIGTDYAATPATGTALTGTYLAKTVEANTDYFLGKDENDAVGFYKWTGTTLAANRAYFEASKLTTNPVKCFVLNFSTPTAISDLFQDAQAGKAIYDLSGRRVKAATRGLYIVNGKKIVVK